LSYLMVLSFLQKSYISQKTYKTKQKHKTAKPVLLTLLWTDVCIKLKISYALLYSIRYSSNSILFCEWLIYSFHHMWTKNISITLNPISYTLSHDLWWPINLTSTRNINTQI
jgi:hypothetical protein